MHRLKLTRPVVFFDLETTGADIIKDRIVEIALIRIHPDGSRDSMVRRVNPELPITPGAFAVHGIRDEDVQDSPNFAAIAQQVFDYFQECDVAGYNVLNFDIPLLAEEFLRVGITPDFDSCHIIDPQQIFFRMEKRTLSAAVEFYCGKTLQNAHSAEADTQAVIDVLTGQLERYPQLAVNVEHLHQFAFGPEPLVDYARRLVHKNGEVCYNFGKYQGRAVRDILKADPAYHHWVLEKEFALHTKQKLRELIAGFGGRSKPRNRP